VRSCRVCLTFVIGRACGNAPGFVLIARAGACASGADLWQQPPLGPKRPRQHARASVCCRPLEDCLLLACAPGGPAPAADCSSTVGPRLWQASASTAPPLRRWAPAPLREDVRQEDPRAIRLSWILALSFPSLLGSERAWLGIYHFKIPRRPHAGPCLARTSPLCLWPLVGKVSAALVSRPTAELVRLHCASPPCTPLHLRLFLLVRVGTPTLRGAPISRVAVPSALGLPPPKSRGAAPRFAVPV